VSAEFLRLDLGQIDIGQLIAITKQAWISRSRCEEHIREGFDHRKVRHTKTVGMNHMGSASHAQRKADGANSSEPPAYRERHGPDANNMAPAASFLPVRPKSPPNCYPFCQDKSNRTLSEPWILPLAQRLRISEVSAAPGREIRARYRKRIVNDLVTSAAAECGSRRRGIGAGKGRILNT
jgi:hypothetical protein